MRHRARGWEDGWGRRGGVLAQVFRRVVEFKMRDDFQGSPGKFAGDRGKARGGWIASRASWGHDCGGSVKRDASHRLADPCPTRDAPRRSLSLAPSPHSSVSRPSRRHTSPHVRDHRPDRCGILGLELARYHSR